MDVLRGENLINQNGDEIPADDVIKEKALILLYFTSQDSEPCRVFDGRISELVRNAEDLGINIQIIIVSKDETQKKMMTSMKEKYSEYLAVPYNSALTETLELSYGVTHLPNLIVLKKNGTIVTKQGRRDLERLGIDVLVTWL